MATLTLEQTKTLRKLDGSLVLRRATPQDAEAVVDLNVTVFAAPAGEEDPERVSAWTTDLLTRPHPTFLPEDYVLVEDTRSGQVVSALNLISQTWSYEGISFGVGRPELVATRPEYRNRGLVRAQFEAIHQLSAEKGQILQAITGIPYYYRQFGYEMALSLGGGRLGYLPHVPELPDGQVEPYHVRAAVESDLPLMAELYDRGVSRYPLRCERSVETWRYELAGKSSANINRAVLSVIETPQGQAVGFMATPISNWGQGVTLAAYVCELKPGVSWGEVAPSLVRFLNKTGEANAEQEKKKPFGAWGFWLGEDHPIYHALADRMPRVRKPYAWYIRVPDLPGFLRLIKPVLERRLVGSPFEGHTGELKITFYRDGLRLVFDAGKLPVIEKWKPEPVGNSGDAGFPGLTFLQMVFGYRSLDELSCAFPDCWTEDGAAGLLEALFPRRHSSVWGIT